MWHTDINKKTIMEKQQIFFLEEFQLINEYLELLQENSWMNAKTGGQKVRQKQNIMQSQKDLSQNI